MHYLGIIAVFMRKVTYLYNGVVHEKEELAMPLIYLSPMAKPPNEDEECDAGNDNLPSVSRNNADEATDFSAATHVRQFEDVFKYFGINIHEWAVCTIADNCRINLKIAELMEIPHVGCTNHKLNLEVNRMVAYDKAMSRAIDLIHDTMKTSRQRIRNRAMLRNLTFLSPITHNVTRWSSKYDMMARFLRIRSELISVSETNGARMTMDKSNAFKNRVLV